MQGNMHLGYEGNFIKNLTLLKEAKIGTYTKQTKWNNIAFLSKIPSSTGTCLWHCQYKMRYGKHF